MKNNSSDLHYSANVETHGVRLKSFWRMRNVLKGRNFHNRMSLTCGYENQVPPGLLRGMGRKRETKYGWNSPLTHSASKKELTAVFIFCFIMKNIYFWPLFF
ncbi:MAG: hypothetical protein LBF89_05505 [Bacteroidales bacterium]|jgi:hypothetical protein|nr:hypothetical protein [Bacteroidales bacterium]